MIIFKIATLSPADICYEESLSTLRYAERSINHFHRCFSASFCLWLHESTIGPAVPLSPGQSVSRTGRWWTRALLSALLKNWRRRTPDCCSDWADWVWRDAEPMKRPVRICVFNLGFNLEEWERFWFMCRRATSPSWWFNPALHLTGQNPTRSDEH